MAFCSHVWMWELGYKEGWVLMDWCFRIVVLEETPENPLNCKEIKPVNTRGNQHWRFIGRTDAQAPILWPPDVKSQLSWERLRAGGEGGDRGWDGWMASPTQWPWIWENSGRWWRTRSPGVLWSTGLATEQPPPPSPPSAFPALAASAPSFRPLAVPAMPPAAVPQTSKLTPTSGLFSLESSLPNIHQFSSFVHLALIRYSVTPY